MKKIIVTSLLIAATAISACAPRASAVSPTSMAGAYDRMNCKSVQAHLSTERENVKTLSQKQNSAATGDAIGVFLIAVPVSSVFGGSVEGDLASAKGKVLALEQRAINCQ